MKTEQQTKITKIEKNIQNLRINMPKPRGGGNWGAGGARGAGGANGPRQKIIPLKTKPTGPILDEDFRISIEKELKEFNENHDAQGKILRITQKIICFIGNWSK